MAIVQYGEKEIQYLSQKDKKLGAAIARIGKIERAVTPDLFTALIDSIVGQQISTKAAVTVRGRLDELLGEMTPENIDSTNIEAIQKCGMSLRKAGYIKGVAEAITSGTFDLDKIHQLSDDEAIKQLSSLHGVGVWTAEMLLIFSLGRPDIVSWGDLGIRRGMMKLYGLEELTKQQFAQYRARYSPYGTVASLYLWAL